MKQNVLYEFIDDFSDKYYHENGNLPMFHVVELALRKELGSNRMVKTLNHVYPIFLDENDKDLQSLANELKISKERVRQLACKYVKQILNVAFGDDASPVFHEVFNMTYWNYVMTYFSNNIIVSEDTLLPILDSEKSMLTPNFAIIILGGILKNNFSLIGNNQYVKGNRLRSYWRHIYLIRFNMTKYFNFDKFIEKAYYYEYGHNTYTICDVHELVTNLFNECLIEQNHSQETKNISLIVGAILILELDKKIDAKNRIAFTGRKIPLNDVVYQLITDSKQDMSILQLFNAINFIYKGRIKNHQTILQAIRTDRRLSVSNKIVHKIL